MKLPKLSNTQRLLRTYQVQFGGLNHTEGASDGEIYDMKNMASDHYPVLCPREKRKYLATLKNATGGMISYGGVIIYADGTELYMLKGGVASVVGEVRDGEKVFAPFRDTVIVFPDKVMVNIETGTMESMGVSLEIGEAYFKAEGMLYGESAENNTIYAPGVDFAAYFKEGDAVEIAGCLLGANNKTPIIREIDGSYLRFYENVFTTQVTRYTFTAKSTLSSVSVGMLAMTPCYGFVKDNNRVAFYLPQDALKGTVFEYGVGESYVNVFFADDLGVPSKTATEVYLESDDVAITNHLGFVGVYGDVKEANITLSRHIPDMDFLITDDNRLWGAKGHTIYGSKLGDPTNFNVFDGLSTDSYSVDIGNAGDITAALTYGGYPTFFKEDGIYRLYGDKPSNFQIMPTMKQGVKAGCEKSLAIAGEVLYYISINGIMAYTGGIPTKADLALGKHIIGGVAASNGVKYYISATEDGEHYSLYVYDTVRNLWHKEDDIHLTYAAYDKAVLGLTDGGELMALSRYDGGMEEKEPEWFVEFADMTFGSPFQKGVVKAHIRFDLEKNATARAEICYDGGEWELIREFCGDGKCSNVLPVIPHRCDHFRLRIAGEGICDIYSMALQYSDGSEIY